MGSYFQGERQLRQEKQKREHYVLKRLSMMSPWDDEENTPLPLRRLQPLFSRNHLQDDPPYFSSNLTIWVSIIRQLKTCHHPMMQKRLMVPNFRTVLSTRPDAPRQVSPTVAPTPRHIAQLQIIMKHQTHLDWLHRYFHSQVEATTKRYKKKKEDNHFTWRKDILPVMSIPQVLTVPLLQLALSPEENIATSLNDKAPFIDEIAKKMKKYRKIWEDHYSLNLAWFRERLRISGFKPGDTKRLAISDPN